MILRQQRFELLEGCLHADSSAMNVYRSLELNGLTSLHHRVDVVTRRPVEYGTPPARIKVG